MNHEKKAFLKFFLIYFVSVALLIVTAGFFYYSQMKEQYLKSEEFSIINYARALKMGNDVTIFGKEYSHKKTTKRFKHFDIKNFQIKEDKFVKYIPRNRLGEYYEIFKSTENFDKKLFDLKMKLSIAEILLLLIFGYISYRLAKNALLPLKKSIQTLDKFAKDLIHDLNTPVTSIRLNMKLLQKEPGFAKNRALKRINRSAHTISELYENLTILLEEKTFQLSKTDIFDIVEEVVQIQKQIHPDIKFQIVKSGFIAKTNKKAMRQILQNIISNACKYNAKNGYVRIYAKEGSLYIEDSGKGIQNPHKIFDRSFSENSGSGIGLDIVKRVALALNLDIKVTTSPNGTIFILTIR